MVPRVAGHDPGQGAHRHRLAARGPDLCPLAGVKAAQEGQVARRTSASSSTSSRNGTASERDPATYSFSSNEGRGACSRRRKQNAR